MSIDSSITVIPDFFLEVVKGNVPGTSALVKRGHNPSQTSASGFVDISEFGDITYLASAETMNIVSTSTDDDGSPVGIGAQTLLIQGIASGGAALQETVTMNGTTNVLTSGSYLRVNNMVALAVGTSGWNVGAITATSSAAATIQDEMDATESISQSSFYTVPSGKTLYFQKAELNVSKQTAGTAPVVEFKGYARNAVGQAWIQLFDKRLDADVNAELDIVIPNPAKLIAGGEIRFRADTDQNSTETRVRYYALLVDS